MPALVKPLRLGVKNHGAAEAFTTATANGNVWTRFEHTFTTGAPIGGGSASVSLAASADDAEESAAGAVTLTSTDLELVEDGDLGSQIIGLRFAGLAVPAGAVKLAAYRCHWITWWTGMMRVFFLSSAAASEQLALHAQLCNSVLDIYYVFGCDLAHEMDGECWIGMSLFSGW